MKIHKTKMYPFDLKRRNKSKLKQIKTTKLNINLIFKIFKYYTRKWSFIKHKTFNFIQHLIFCQTFTNGITWFPERFYFKRYKTIQSNTLLHQLKIKQTLSYYYGLIKSKQIKILKNNLSKIYFNTFYLKTKKYFNLIFQFEKRIDVILFKIFFFCFNSSK